MAIQSSKSRQPKEVIFAAMITPSQSFETSCFSSFSCPPSPRCMPGKKRRSKKQIFQLANAQTAFFRRRSRDVRQDVHDEWDGFANSTLFESAAPGSSRERRRVNIPLPGEESEAFRTRPREPSAATGARRGRPPSPSLYGFASPVSQII